MPEHSLKTNAIKVLKMPMPGKLFKHPDRVSNGATTPTKYIGGSQDTGTESNATGGPKIEHGPQAIACDKFVATLSNALFLSDGETPPDILNLRDGIVISYGLEDADGLRTGRTKTKFYREAYTVRIDGERVAKLLQRSNDGCGYSELTMYNHVLYRKGWTNYVVRLLRKLDAVVHQYTGIDVAIDGYNYLDKVHRIWLEEDVKNFGRSSLRPFFDSTGKILTGLDIGAKSADNRLTIYDKSPEFETKPYQKENCERFGLDTSKPIHRNEVKLRAAVLRRFCGFPPDDVRTTFIASKEYELNSKEAIKEFSRSIIERRDNDIAQARKDARDAINALDDYYGPEANKIRLERETVVCSIRRKYREERLVLNAAKADSKVEDIEYIESVDNSIDDLLNGNFDFRQLENLSVLADIHKRSSRSLLKIRKGTNKRADRNEKIEVVNYDAFGAMDVQLSPLTKEPKPIWGVQRKISFDIRASYAELDLMTGNAQFEKAMADCQKTARKYGIVDWFTSHIPKWKEDKEYHDAIKRAVQSAPARWNTASLGFWMPRPGTTEGTLNKSQHPETAA
ncbi:hypothetical protein FUA23_03050 [Neolewinella aurantiaca]|uniref:Uncharacterized protein n=1 Tax=Neolewinella aurantiaca TaxID=2602767 RepID=A0A5C7G0I7_9BACT|nr:hypothetical protein [Neolewinella aurantiaca]TXF91215.1 hypothetical protein FUA23_03050 [Neolewinella aurantiaca]